jgi:hypothetical protein
MGALLPLRSGANIDHLRELNERGLSG